jgi:ABC-2 type transport system permease protein
MTGLFFKHFKIRFARYFKKNRLAKLVTVGMFLMVFFLVALGIYFFARRGFMFIAKDPFLRSAMPLYIYEQFLLFVSFLAFISGLITSAFGLFKNYNDKWIMATPRYRSVFFWNFWKIFSSSVWPLFVVVLPAFLAIRSIFDVFGVFDFIFLMALVALLTALMVLAAVIVVMGAAKILHLMSKYLKSNFVSIGWLTALLFLVVAALFAFTRIRVATHDVVELFQATDVATASASVGLIYEQFSVFPSHFVAVATYALQNGVVSTALLQGLKLLLLTLAVFVGFYLMSNLYLVLWQAFQEGGYKAKAEAAVSDKKPKVFPRFLKGPVGALLEKEAIVSMRTGKNLMWFLFLLSLWLIQTALNDFVSITMSKYAINRSIVPGSIQALQMATIVYFVTAFVMRFAFPAFSSEKKTSWIVLSSPVNMKKVYYAKLLFYGASFLAVGVVVGLLNIAILQFPILSALLSFIMFLTAIIFVTVYGLSLGAIFPNFDTDDPQVLSTTLPGLGFMFGSLFYGAIGAALLYVFISGGSVLGFVFFEVLSFVVVGALVYLAPRSLQKKEFVKIGD